MMRRFILAAALIVSSAAVVLAVPATVVLKGGQRVSGELTYKAGGNDITVDGHDYSLDNVAVISYVPGDPTAAELNSVPAVDDNPSELERHAFVMRDGQTIMGKLYKFSADGRTVTFDERGGNRRDVQADQLARIYIHPASARQAFGPGVAGNAAAAGVPGPGAIRVPANQWVPANINVQAGETIRFASQGEIRWSPNPADRATPAGAVNGSHLRTAPVPNAPAGALIGRVGNAGAFNRGGQVFLIGAQGVVTMPAAGPLFLGINDDSLGDNTGDFFVTISK